MAFDDAVPRVDARQPRAEARFGRWNRRLAALVAVVALVGAVLPDPWGPGAAVAAVALIIAAPVGRVLWLVALWYRQGDRRFVGVGVVLLCIMAVGVVAAALRGG